MNKIKRILLLFILMFTTYSFSEPLTVVETDKVCMVNDRFFNSPQIPVLVDGKTYYGCCAACKKTLNTDKSIRFSKDPVTGELVDKALAVIGSKKDGSVYYFKSKNNLAKYVKSSK